MRVHLHNGVSPYIYWRKNDPYQRDGFSQGKKVFGLPFVTEKKCPPFLPAAYYIVQSSTVTILSLIGSSQSYQVFAQQSDKERQGEYYYTLVFYDTFYLL